MDIAAAMGFASFGATKKRKYDQSNAPQPSKADASGANSTQLGMRTKKSTSEAPEHLDIVDRSTTSTLLAKAESRPKSGQQSASAGLADFLARAQTLPDRPPQAQEHQQPESAPSQDPHASASEMLSFGGPAISKAELNALRFGVKNEHGDTAYFLPDFVKNPWERLERGK